MHVPAVDAGHVHVRKPSKTIPFFSFKVFGRVIVISIIKP